MNTTNMKTIGTIARTLALLALAVTLIVGASFTAVTLGSTVAAVPLVVPSLGVSVKAGRSLPALTRARPAAVRVTLPLPSRA